MSFIKRIIEKLAKNQQNINKTLTSREQTINQQIAENQQTISKTLTLESAHKISDFPLMVYLIGGKQGEGKTTLTYTLESELKQKGFTNILRVNSENFNQIKTAENTVIIIDDLSRDLTKKAINVIVENLRIARHKRNIYIISHHIINDFPTELMQLSDKIVMFKTAFNPALTSKINTVISKSKIQQLHEIALSIPKYQYVIVKDNDVFGYFSNKDAKPILEDYGLKRLNANSKTQNGNSNNHDELLAIVKAKIPEFQYLTLTSQILKLSQMFPELKPKKIAEIVNTTPNTVRVILCRVRSS